MVTRGMAGQENVVLSYDLERAIAERLADGFNSVGERARYGCVAAREHVMAAHEGRDPPESALVVERPGNGLGFPEIHFDPSEFCQRVQRVSKIEADIDRLLQRLASL